MSRLVAALVVIGAALTGCSAPVALCDSDASCAALGTGYGVTDAKLAAYGPALVTQASATPAAWNCLRDLGYVGDPTDGVEALYAPASDIADCTL